MTHLVLSIVRQQMRALLEMYKEGFGFGSQLTHRSTYLPKMMNLFWNQEAQLDKLASSCRMVYGEGWGIEKIWNTESMKQSATDERWRESGGEEDSDPAHLMPDSENIKIFTPEVRQRFLKGHYKTGRAVLSLLCRLYVNHALFAPPLYAKTMTRRWKIL